MVAATAGSPVPVSAVAAGTTVVFDDPGSGLQAGAVVPLRGRVSSGSTTATGTPTVLYVIDASASTGEQRGADCDGSGASDANDDLNGDSSVGDTLDCEIAAVQALNQMIAGSVEGASVGLEAFATVPAVADLHPSALAATFIAPGQVGTGTEPWLVTAARSVKRGAIQKFTGRSLSGTGTDLDAAAGLALSTLSGAPAGPKWVFLFSDGQAAVDASTLSAVAGSGVKVRSFAVGAGQACDARSAMARLAAASGETCVPVGAPASLPGQVLNSQPDDITGVVVEVAGRRLQADVDALGGWSTSLVFGEGSYTATVTATARSGATARATRTFTVLPGGTVPAGTVVLPPGTRPVTAPPLVRAVQLTRVRYNPPGPDTRRNARAEYVALKNTGILSVGLKGWTVRDASGHAYTFPATRLGPRDTVIVRTGLGSNQPGIRFWGRTRHVWNNKGPESALLRDSLRRQVDACQWRSTAAAKVTC